MFRTLALLAVVVTASCASALTGIQDVSLRIEMENGGVCSATAVGKRLLLTAEHCLDGTRIVAINGREAYALKIVRDGKDHALVRVTERFNRWARMGQAPEQGERVRWIGQPAGMERIYREGSVAGENSGHTLIDAQAYGGDSGSGLFDERGRVVGVLSGMRRWQNRQGFSMQLVVAFPLQFTAEQWRAVQ